MVIFLTVRRRGCAVTVGVASAGAILGDAAGHAQAGVGPADWVVDVGAGMGVLTGPLVAAGAHVIAVEAHPERERLLRQRFGDAVILVQADAHELRLPKRPYHVVANPPFRVTSALLRRLLKPGSVLRSAHLILQEQAVRRWAGPTAPSRSRWKPMFQTAIGSQVPRSAFLPRPRVSARCS